MLLILATTVVRKKRQGVHIKQHQTCRHLLCHSVTCLHMLIHLTQKFKVSLQLAVTGAYRRTKQVKIYPFCDRV